MVAEATSIATIALEPLNFIRMVLAWRRIREEKRHFSNLAKVGSLTESEDQARSDSKSYTTRSRFFETQKKFLLVLSSSYFLIFSETPIDFSGKEPKATNFWSLNFRSIDSVSILPTWFQYQIYEGFSHFCIFDCLTGIMKDDSLKN